jgi:hypothetical protein
MFVYEQPGFRIEAIAKIGLIDSVIQTSLISIPSWVMSGSLDWLLATCVMASHANVSVINKRLLMMCSIKISFLALTIFPPSCSMSTLLAIAPAILQ